MRDAQLERPRRVDEAPPHLHKHRLRVQISELARGRGEVGGAEPRAERLAEPACRLAVGGPRLRVAAVLERVQEASGGAQWRLGAAVERVPGELQQQLRLGRDATLPLHLRRARSRSRRRSCSRRCGRWRCMHRGAQHDLAEVRPGLHLGRRGGKRRDGGGVRLRVGEERERGVVNTAQEGDLTQRGAWQLHLGSHQLPGARDHCYARSGSQEAAAPRGRHERPHLRVDGEDIGVRQRQYAFVASVPTELRLAAPELSTIVSVFEHHHVSVLWIKFHCLCVAAGCVVLGRVPSTESRKRLEDADASHSLRHRRARVLCAATETLMRCRPRPPERITWPVHFISEDNTAYGLCAFAQSVHGK